MVFPLLDRPITFHPCHFCDIFLPREQLRTILAWAPASGRVMAELVLDGKAKSINLDPFDPARFTKEAKGGRGRKQRGTNVGEQW